MNRNLLLPALQKTAKNRKWSALGPVFWPADRHMGRVKIWVMNKEQYAKRTFILEGIGGIEVTEEWRHPDYVLTEITPDAKTDERGKLEMFRIRPTRHGLPEFIARLGHDDQNAVDIQLDRDKAESRAFRTRAPGYIGHRTDQISTDPPSYKIDIHVPSVGRVFASTVTLRTVHLGLRVNDKL